VKVRYIDGNHIHWVDECIRRIITQGKVVKPGLKGRFFWDEQDDLCEPITIKPMLHKFKSKSPNTFGVLNGLHIGGQVNINAHTLPHVVAAAVRRTMCHKDEDTGRLWPLPKYNYEVVDRLYDGVLLNFKLTVVAFVSYWCTFKRVVIPWTRAQYVDNIPAHKKRLYKQKSKTLEISPLADGDFVIRPRIKAEKKPDKKDFISRLFFPYETKVNIELGRYLKPLEHLTYEGIDSYYEKNFGTTHYTVMKGCNAPEKAARVVEKWDKFKDPIAIELDCTHFDKHVNQRLLKLEQAYYQSFYPKDKYLAGLLRKQLINKLSATTNDGYRVNWQTLGGRMSGCVNTALGNIYIVCIIFATYAAELKSLGIKFEYVNEGDDCFFIVEKNDRTRIPDIFEHFFNFGLRVRIENEVSVLQKLRFCQTAPIFINGAWRMIRDPRAVLFKDTTQLYCATAKNTLKWLHEVGVGGLILNAGVPILQELYTAYIRLGCSTGTLTNNQIQDLSNSGLFSLIKGMNKCDSTITPENRSQFYLMTQVHPDIQLQVEQMLRNIMNIQFENESNKIAVFGQIEQMLQG